MNSKEKNSVEEENAVDKSKRRISVAGVAAPVLLGLTSKTVWGAGAACTTSGKLSGNVSSGHTVTSQCDAENPFGVSPGWWVNNGINAWPVSKDLKFNTHPVFSCRPLKIKLSGTQTWNTNPTLLQVMSAHQGNNQYKKLDGTTDSSLQNDTFHAISAYLNALTPTYAFPFSVDDIKTMFCSNNMTLIKDFQKDTVIHGGADVVKQWLINNNMYHNGLVD
jgi:hypothetical protein